MNKDQIANLRAVLEYSQALGFDRLPIAAPPSSVAKSPPIALSPPIVNSNSNNSNSDKAEALKALRAEIGDCRRCKLSEGRTNLVFGEGNPEAVLMFIGEGPGREEDAQGRPFVGEAGGLLTKLINRMGFKREDVYIGNIVKCRPHMNRDPEPDETGACLPFIQKQIEAISPHVIIALGRIAAHALTNTKTPISRLRGHFHDYMGIPLMPTFHPAYLLRNPRDKFLVWDDAIKVLNKLGRSPAH